MQKQSDDYVLDDDPTLSACCIRDLQERKQAAAWKAELKQNDPVERAEARARQGAGIASLFTSNHHSHSHLPLNISKGSLAEVGECDISSIVSGGQFVVCLAMSETPSELQSSLREWIDGFDAILVAHIFRPAACRNCFLNENIRLPALIVWNKGERQIVLERNRLEAETEVSLIARLTLLKRQASDSNDSEEESDERETGRNAYFRCGKPGCDRSFHHVHVKDTWKNSAFETNDVKMKASDSDDDDL